MSRIFTTLFIFIALGLNAQNKKDTSERVFMIDGHYSFHIPGGDLKQRFGNSSTVGAQFSYKFASNWIIGADYSFIFGQNVKNSEGYFKAIKTTKGYVLDGNGKYAEIYLYERGMNLAFSIEKQFNIFGLNPNSGLFIKISPGYLYHKVRIENPGNVTPQVLGDYSKGYDRLSGGFSLSEMVGFRYLDKNNIWNFYAGFEMTQAWTKSLRSYNFDDLQANTDERFDMLSGFRVGWIITIRHRSPDEFYYY